MVDSSAADIVERDYRQAAVVDERPQYSTLKSALYPTPLLSENRRLVAEVMCWDLLLSIDWW